MCFGAFLFGVILTVVVGVLVLVYIGRHHRGGKIDDGAATIQFAVEDFINELGDESDEYLRKLQELLNKKVL